MPVSPWSASSFGSVHRDAPGLLREWGSTNTMFLATSAAGGSAFCSATGSTGSEYPVLPVLTAGQTLNIFGFQAVAASDGSADSKSMQVALEVTDADGNNGVYKVVGGATSKGPFFQSYELPVKIAGPGRVRVIPLQLGDVTSLNYVTIQYIIVDESASQTQ